jgi:hypothetical protein
MVLFTNIGRGTLLYIAFGPKSKIRVALHSENSSVERKYTCSPSIMGEFRGVKFGTGALENNKFREPKITAMESNCFFIGIIYTDFYYKANIKQIL